MGCPLLWVNKLRFSGSCKLSVFLWAMSTKRVSVGHFNYAYFSGSCKQTMFLGIDGFLGVVGQGSDQHVEAVTVVIVNKARFVGLDCSVLSFVSL